MLLDYGESLNVVLSEEESDQDVQLILFDYIIGCAMMSVL
jgi:hypothetical protein